MKEINYSDVPLVVTYPHSIYDMSLESLDSEDNILAKNKGKVTMIVNVTGECANSAQYTPIQDLYDKYKDLGFEVIAVPSTDFCDDAYGPFKESNASPVHMRNHMKELYKTDLPFSKMTAIVENSETGLPVHPFYKLVQEYNFPIKGNFEKFIINRDGTKVVRYCNSDLLDLGYNAGNRTVDSKKALQNITNTIEAFLHEQVDPA
jgi:glutathione peroxidase